MATMREWNSGLPGAGKSRLIEAWREAAHPQKAIAVLSNGSPVRLPSGSGAGEVRLRSPRFGLGRPQRQEGARESGSPSADPPWLETLSGCLCCTARAALPAVLARLQKRGPWDHLLIELNGAARPAAFIDLLRSPALASHVRLVGVIAVVDARLPLPASARVAALLSEQVATADRLWLRGPPVSAEPPSAPADKSWQAWLRSFREFDDPPESWCTEAAPPRPLEPPWTDAPLLTRSGRLASWQSSPTHVHDRAGLETALSRAIEEGCFERVTAAFRTERDWYVWRCGRGTGTGRIADPCNGSGAGRIESGRPTLYRSSNRLDLELAATGPLTDDTGERLTRWFAGIACHRISGP
jgi:hypothetical protein